MLASLQSAAVLGVDAHRVLVEVDVSFGLPAFTMVGLPDATVRESRDRVRAAIRNSGFDFPPHRITVNLAPADVRKAGSLFDLPIALGLMAASGVVVQRAFAETVVLGELSLDGAINGIRGVLPIAMAAARLGWRRILLPVQNAGEAAVVDGLELCEVASLAEAVDALNRPDQARVRIGRSDALLVPSLRDAEDISDVRGQVLPKRALEIAAAGGHNLLLQGPPGAGKTMLARRLPGILPALSVAEALECSTIHSVAAHVSPDAGLVRARPFRAPHHSISPVALVGGGFVPRPGEISLAHHGVLFLDEIPEFDRRVLEVLRQPLEEGRITVARATRTVVFPARFILVAAMNPCPCGFHGDERRACHCTPAQIGQYRSRLSGPLRDRLDLVVDVPAVPPSLLGEPLPGEDSATIRERVSLARIAQETRLGAAGATNAILRGRDLATHARPDRQGLALLRSAAERLGLSARGFDRVLRVARTIADLAGSVGVEAAHVAEAVQYRLPR